MKTEVGSKRRIDSESAWTGDAAAVAAMLASLLYKAIGVAVSSGADGVCLCR